MEYSIDEQRCMENIRASMQTKDIVKRNEQTFTELTTPAAQSFMQKCTEFANNVCSKLAEYYVFEYIIEAREYHKRLFGCDFTAKHLIECKRRQLGDTPTLKSVQVSAIFRNLLQTKTFPFDPLGL